MRTVCLILIIVSCGCKFHSKPFTPRVSYYHLQPLDNIEGFIAIESYDSIRLSRHSIVIIDSIGGLHYLTGPISPPTCFLSQCLVLTDSTVLITFTDTSNYKEQSLILYNLATRQSTELGTDLRVVALSKDKRFILAQNEDSSWKTLLLFSIENERLTLLKSYPNIDHQGFAATDDNNFLVESSQWIKNRGRQAVNYTLNTKTLSLDTTNLKSQGGEFLTGEDTALIYLRPWVQGMNLSQLHKYSIRKHVFEIFTDSMIISRTVHIPNAHFIIFRGSTFEEHKREADIIWKANEQFLKDNPDIICAIPAKPRGFWRTIDLQKGIVRKIDNSFEYLLTTLSGKYILMKDSNASFQVKPTQLFIEN